MRQLVAAALVVVALGVAVDFAVSGALDAQQQRSLLSVADLLGERAALQPIRANDRITWQAFTALLAKRAHARVTIFSRDGRTLGDSALERGTLPGDEPTPPEVTDALERGHGYAERDDESFVAVPFVQGGQVAGVVRVSGDLDETTPNVHLVVGLATLAALVALFVASTLVRRTAREVDTTALVRRLTSGDLDTRIDEPRELEELRRSVSSSLGALRRERDLLARVLDGMAEGVLLIDGDGKVALVNPALRELFLLGRESTGKLPLEVVRHPELHRLLESSRAAGGVETGEVELSGLKPRRLLVRVQPLSGDPPAQLAVFVDVTDLRRLESLRRDFVANVSHELRTPVAAVRSAAETLHDAVSRDPAAVPTFVDIIERNAERLARLVEDLLDLSRIDAREYRIDLEPLDPAQAIDQTLALFRERATTKRIRLVADAPAALRVKADRRALEQVLTNLLDNALKYAGDGAEVRVSAARESNRRIRIDVADTGPGVEPKHLPRLFERFYRVDKGRSREVGGTGLGLSIVKNLVEAMGGSVDVASAPGQGSTFTVRLPSADEEAGS